MILKHHSSVQFKLTSKKTTKNKHDAKAACLSCERLSLRSLPRCVFPFHGFRRPSQGFARQRDVHRRFVRKFIHFMHDKNHQKMRANACALPAGRAPYNMSIWLAMHACYILARVGPGLRALAIHHGHDIAAATLALAALLLYEARACIIG